MLAMLAGQDVAFKPGKRGPASIDLGGKQDNGSETRRY
jgi:hypothetical protein